MTNTQLYLAIGLPMIWNTLLIGFMWSALDRRITREIDSLKELWRAELHRVEEILDARLKHLEGRA